MATSEDKFPRRKRNGITRAILAEDGVMSETRRLLEEKRDKLRAELARLETPPQDTGGISFGKRVGEGTSLAVERMQEVAAHDKAQTVLAEVERSLGKLDEDTYGSCDNCGGSIAPERLEALPWATFCVACAAKKKRSA